MNQEFEILSGIIRNRRTVKPQTMNGKRIPDEQVSELLALADWAPTHGNTEPWRFYVYAGDGVARFCQQHAELYRQHVAEERFTVAGYEKLLHMGDKASHVIVAVMRRGDLPKIPALEEIAATSAAIQNLLLGAQASGIAAYWGSGGMAYQPPMKDLLGLREEDLVLGVLYLGYSDEPARPGRRNTGAEQKIHWM